MNNNENAGSLKALVTLMGGSDVGFNMNPDAKNKPTFIEINGEKVVCMAQAGECRHYGQYYTGSLNDSDSWVTPIISESCPDKCWYKYLVCDEHKHTNDEEEDIGKITYYPERNKFRGQFTSYCKDFEKIHKKNNEPRGKPMFPDREAADEFVYG